MGREISDLDFVAVRRQVRAFHRSSANHFADDLESAAMEGLRRAANDWRPEGGESWPSHRYRRVKSILIDELRNLTCNRHRNSPVVLSFDGIPAWLPSATDGDDGRHPWLIDPDADTEAEALERIHYEEMVHRARQWFKTLDSQQAFIISHRLIGETHREIGETLGLTEARICQVSSKVRKQLQEAYA